MYCILLYMILSYIGLLDTYIGLLDSFNSQTDSPKATANWRGLHLWMQRLCDCLKWCHAGNTCLQMAKICKNIELDSVDYKAIDSGHSPPLSLIVLGLEHNLWVGEVLHMVCTTPALMAVVENHGAWSTLSTASSKDQFSHSFPPSLSCLRRPLYARRKSLRLQQAKEPRMGASCEVKLQDATLLFQMLTLNQNLTLLPTLFCLATASSQKKWV